MGFRDLDDDHLAMYLLDVTGHGGAAALLSVTAPTADSLVSSVRLPVKVWVVKEPSLLVAVTSMLCAAVVS